MNTNYLLSFKDLQISKKELNDKLGGNLLTLKIVNPVTIHTEDVVNVLSAFKDGKIKLNQLLEWVNTVWFTDLFDYNDEQCDSIASVLNKLEELDEDGKELTGRDIDNYIAALINNLEV